MATAISVQAQSIITTVAGKGRILPSLGGPATGVQFGIPRGTAFDSKGNRYIADMQENVVFVLRPNGTIAVFAGIGIPDFSGDGGPATAAALRLPVAVAVDTADNVYIADLHNARIRKVDRSGIITSIAGGGRAYHVDEIPATAALIFEPNGMAFDSSGALYFSQSGDSLIRKITPDGIIHHVAGTGSGGFSGDGGPAATCAALFPRGAGIRQ